MISVDSCGDRPFKSQSGNLAVGGVDSGEIEISFKIGKVKALIELFLGLRPNYFNNRSLRENDLPRCARPHNRNFHD